MNVLELPPGTIEDDAEMLPASTNFKQVWYCTAKSDVPHFHRLRGPAILWGDGEEEWYRHGKPYTPTAHEKMLWELRKKNESV